MRAKRLAMNCRGRHDLKQSFMNWLRHELRQGALRKQAIQFMECVAREFMKSLISIHDTECQIISFHGANAHGKGIVTAKFNKNVVLIVTHSY